MIKLGIVVAIVGFVICAMAGGARLMGEYYLLGYEGVTLLQAGTALMVTACTIRLYFPDKE